MDNFIYLKDFYDRNYSTFTTRINPESFIPQLRSACILSECDQDEICNHYVYTNKVQRAGVFINILKTKGDSGFKKFKELLGWEYPHVFEEVFQDETPSPAPKGYPVNDASRKSCDLHDLMKYGFNQRHILGEYKVVLQKLVDLQELLQFTQLEKNDLEMEIQRLRELEVLTRQQEEKLKEFEKDNKHVKEENREFMRKNIHLRDESDHQANRIQALLYERDRLERQLDSKSVDLDRLNECQSELQENFEQERRISQRLHRQCNDLKTARSRPLNVAQNLIDRNSDNNRLLQTRIEILETDLEQERESNHTLLEDLNIAREQNYQQKDTINKLQSNIYALKKESEKSTLWYKKAEHKTEEYYKTIQQLQQEKRKVEEEKIVSQQMNWDLEEQKNVLFQRKHELERQLELCHREHDKLKADMLRERFTYRRTANVSRCDDSDNLQSAETLLSVSQTNSHLVSGSNYESESVGLTFRNNRDSLIVNMGSQKQPCPVEKEIEDDEDIYCKPQCKSFKSDTPSILSTESGLEESLQIDRILPSESPSQHLCRKDYVVLLNVVTLSSVELCCDKDSSEIVVNKLYVQNANLQIGDVIFQLQYQIGVEDVVVSFNDITVDEAQKAVEKCLTYNPGIISVHIRPGATTNREILDKGHSYFRYNLTDTEPVIGEQTCLRVDEGEIIFVDVNFENKFWKTQKVDQKTGRRLKADGVIPNIDQAKKLFSTCKVEPTSPWLQDNSSKTGYFTRKKVIKRSKVGKSEQCSPYNVVLPIKACTPLPVLVRGTETVVTAVLDFLKTTDTSWANVVNEQKPWSDLTKENKHAIIPYTLGLIHSDGKSMNCYLIINIVCKQNKKDCLKWLFDKDCVGSIDDEDVKDLVPEPNIHSKNLTIDGNITDAKCFLSVLYENISSLQSEIFWMDIDFKW